MVAYYVVCYRSARIKKDLLWACSFYIAPSTSIVSWNHLQMLDRMLFHLSSWKLFRLSPCTFIYAGTMLSGTFPDFWKMSRVFPAFMTGNQCIISNYRGIYALCAASKLFEIIVFGFPHAQLFQLHVWETIWINIQAVNVNKLMCRITHPLYFVLY